MSSSLPKLRSVEALRIIRGASKALREAKKVDPRDRYVVLFPDSSRARLGMGRALLSNNRAEEVFEEASEYMKKDLLKLCTQGPKQELLGSLASRNIATFVTSHAAMEKLGTVSDTVVPLTKASGGLGVGVVNGLVFGGSLSFIDGLDLVKHQSEAIDKVTSLVPSATLQIRVRAATRKLKVCRAAVEHCLRSGIHPEHAVCSVSKQIRAHVIEIGGHEEAIKYLEREGERLFRFHRFKRVRNTPSACHTQLMQPVKSFMELYLEKKIAENADFLKETDTCSVFSATSGARIRFLEEIKKDLIEYSVQPQRVEQLLHTLFARPDNVAQPNVLVIGDEFLLNNLRVVNRKAADCAKLIRTI